MIAASVLASMVLAETYARLARLLSSDVWVAAGVHHTIFACICLYFMWVRRIRPVGDVAQGARRYVALVPALVVIAATILGASATRLWLPGAPGTQDLTLYHIAWVLWIPAVEELTFRVMFGAIYRERLGVLWGSYTSALFFSVMHSFPLAQRWLSGDVGVALGPLILGLICEFIWVKTGRIMPIILFHAACNMTVPLFLKIDQRWLSWLGILYQ